MPTIDEDIETMRALARLSWDRRDWFGWWFASSAVLAWRIARWARWAK